MSQKPTKWTPEPWAEIGLCSPSCSILGEASEDYKRASVCVNTFAGVENPEEAIKELVDAVRDIFPVFEPASSMIGKHRIERLRAAIRPFWRNP